MFRLLLVLLTLTLSSLMSSLALANAPQSTTSPAENNSRELPIKDVQRFTTAISQIKNYYVEPVDDKKLFENAIRGMLSNLDPHSAYLDENDFNDLKSATSGEFTGLGIEVTMEDGLIKVISPIEGTPADKAGVKPGDWVVRLDQTPVKGLNLRDAVNKMRGKKGSSILLTIVREGEKKPLMIAVTRDVIQVKSVRGQMIGKDIAYIRISHFQAPTSEDFLKTLDALKKESNNHISGLVLDLRNNPGGLLDSAIAISDNFIHNNDTPPDELIVYTKGRLPGSEIRAVATPGDVLQGAPMVVLINEGSASGSEIVAGALQDNHRAILLGTKTFGKGSVQTVLPLDANHAVKLTTALYYTPKGRSIQATGIEPDIKIENLQVSKEKDTDSKDIIQESQLTNHLANGNAATAEKNKPIDSAQSKKDATDTALLKKDYQLQEAVNLLRGLKVLKGKS